MSSVPRVSQRPARWAADSSMASAWPYGLSSLFGRVVAASILWTCHAREFEPCGSDNAFPIMTRDERMASITADVRYLASDGVPIHSYLARPEGEGRYPGILMCYEFWGMLEVPAGGPHMREVAQRFAAAGYVALVPDYYAARGQQPSMEGGTIVGGPPDEQADRDLCDAVHWLQQQPFVDAHNIGVIGWCGGGRHALYLAARCPEVRAVASFYGRPVNRP